MAKFGNFEWILNFDQLEPAITTVYSALQDKETASVCIIGCGTSTLASDLCNIGFSSVIAVDNDVGVIEHMKHQQQVQECTHAIEYHICDLTDDTLNVPFFLRDNSFDLVVDKGTLDAILVEGSITNMLLHIHRILKLRGTYFLCSIHTEELLLPLLSRPPLCYDVEVMHLPNTSKEQGTVLIARKSHINSIIVGDMISTEDEIMKQHYQVDHPLLTPELRESIIEYYDAHGTSSLPAKEAYHVMFPSQEFLHYDIELFLEDMSRFKTEQDGYLTLEEALRFILENQ